MFTFNDVGYILFDQTKWATYMEAMKEDKAPPDCSRHMQADLTYLLRVAWTKDGWMDTLEEEKFWDEDEVFSRIWLAATGRQVPRKLFTKTDKTGCNPFPVVGTSRH